MATSEIGKNKTLDIDWIDLSLPKASFWEKSKLKIFGYMPIMVVCLKKLVLVATISLMYL